MPTYVIGDVQGCYSQLLELLERIELASSDAKLIFVGDLVNRGPHSLATLRHIQKLGSKASVLLGNHDLHLLAATHGIRQAHLTDTLDEILQAPDRDSLLEWLRHQPLARFENGYLFVHAGVLPQWTAEQTLKLASEVQAALRGPHWHAFLRGMYGNSPAKWDDNLVGADRLRCIVNALTRIRFCTQEGVMEFSTKEGSRAAPQGYLPWFEVPGRKTGNVPVVFGHWSTLGLMLRPNLIALDTGCVWGGKLTAVRLEDRSVFQVECPQFRQPGGASRS